MTEKTKAQLEEELAEIKNEINEEKATPEIEKKEVEIEVKTLVVSELPRVETRTGNIGNESYNLITVDEALTEILELVRETKKIVG